MKTINKSMVLLGILTLVLQSCTNNDYVKVSDADFAMQTAYQNADAVNGSKLFSNFLHVDAGWPIVTQADIDKDASLAGLLYWQNPKVAADPTINIKDITNPPRTTPATSGQSNLNFYSCISCHPSDGMGRNEYGIGKKIAATQPDIAANHLKEVKTWETKKLFDAIKNVGGRAIDPTKSINGLDPTLGGQTHPDFSRILTDEKIWDLVKWLKEGAIYNENNDLYTATTTGTYIVSQTGTAAQLPFVTYSNLGSDGDEAAGVAFYAAKCTVCHGVDGHGTTNAQGPVLGIDPITSLPLINGTGAANAPIPGTATKKYGIGPFMRYRTADGMIKIIAGQFGTMPWMAATPITRDEMKNLLKAFNGPKGIARFPDFDAALPNP